MSSRQYVHRKDVNGAAHPGMKEGSFVADEAREEELLRMRPVEVIFDPAEARKAGLPPSFMLDLNRVSPADHAAAWKSASGQFGQSGVASVVTARNTAAMGFLKGREVENINSGRAAEAPAGWGQPQQPQSAQFVGGPPPQYQQPPPAGPQVGYAQPPQYQPPQYQPPASNFSAPPGFRQVAPPQGFPQPAMQQPRPPAEPAAGPPTRKVIFRIPQVGDFEAWYHDVVIQRAALFLILDGRARSARYLADAVAGPFEVFLDDNRGYMVESTGIVLDGWQHQTVSVLTIAGELAPFAEGFPNG